MAKRTELDERIGELVRSIRKDVPAGLEEKIKAAAARRPSESLRPERNRRFWLPLTAGSAAAALLLTLLMDGPFIEKKPGSSISEIRTQFELVDKNITIVFIQKPDFKLNLEE
jgi:hypothetical protein